MWGRVSTNSTLYYLNYYNIIHKNVYNIVAIRRGAGQKQTTDIQMHVGCIQDRLRPCDDL